MRLRYCLLVWILLAGVAFSDDNPATLIQEGNELFAQMKYEEAVKIYTQGIERFPDEAVLYYNRGNAYQKIDKLEDALSDYDEAIKRDPKKILLKNIYFNKGNVKYKQAETKRENAKDQIDDLKLAIADYESAGDDYRKSLDLARDLFISKNMDFNKAGQYAKKNWALAREGWTETWEQIKSLERKNMKLEDGINQLLASEMDLLPHLESYFLNSMTEDMLRFNLKTLAQFHMDNRDDLVHMKALAAKEIERANAELENDKASLKTNTPPATPAPTGVPTMPSGSEQEKLAQALDEAKEIEKAVNEAVGLSEWIVDGLNTGDAIKAWKHAGMMIALLQNLNGYLLKEDMIKNNYTFILSQCRSVDLLLSVVDERKKNGDMDPSFKTFEQKALQLSTEKMDDMVRRLLTVNSQLETLINTLSKTDRSAENKTKEANEVQSEKMAFFKDFNENATISTLSSVRDNNNSIMERLKSMAGQLTAEKEIEDGAMDAVQDQVRHTTAFYLHAGQPLQALMVALLDASTTMAQEVRAAIDENLSKNIGARYKHRAALGDVMLFKYQLLADHLEKTPSPELGLNHPMILENLKAVEAAVQSVKTLTNRTVKDNHDAESLAVAFSQLKEKTLEGLQMIFPEAAIIYYYERLAETIGKSGKLLPSTPANKKDIMAVTKPLADDLSTLSKIMGTYFEGAAKAADKLEEKAASTQKKNVLFQQQASMAGVEKSIKEEKAMTDAYQSDRFDAGDLLLKDMAAALEKSRMIFSGKPDKAVDALKTAIHYQEMLKEQSLSAMDMETKGETPSGLPGFLMNNQKDIQLFSGIATMKIRETIDDSQSAPPNDPKATQPNQGPKADPKKLEEAIKVVQDAMIEEEKIRAFLGAGEYNNTVEKHDTVVSLLEKALDLLQKDDQQNNQKENSDDQDKKQGDKNQEQPSNQGENGQNNNGGQRQAKPLELTPQQARELLNELNKQDQGKREEKQAVKQPVNVPRPW